MDTIVYEGYFPESPWWKEQSFKKDGWIESEVGWFCYTGLKEFKISPNKCSLIEVGFVVSKSKSLKFGVEYYYQSNTKERTTKWTRKIEN